MVKEHNFIPNAEQFSFSENYVFGKFDVFCERLSKIIAMFDSIDDYNYLFDRRMEGLLLGERKYWCLFFPRTAKYSLRERMYRCLFLPPSTYKIKES